MIKKPFIQNKPYTPYIPPNRFDDRPISKQIFKGDNSALNAEMSSVILSANPTEILNFFTQNSFTSYTDNDGNSPVHLIVIIDDNKLGEPQKIDLMKQLIVDPFNLSIDSTNNRGETPLHIAVKKQFSQIVEFFIKNGANPNKINFYHQNCLHLAMIPNIKPCEQPTQPNALIEVDQSLEDKNIFYNQILAIFYNNKDKFTDVIDLINTHVEFIFTNYYNNYKHNRITLIDDKTIGEKLTPLEVAMQDIQNKIGENILNKKNNESTIKKNISYYIINALSKMTKVIEDFMPNSTNEINIDGSNYINVGMFDFDKILNEIKMFQAPNSTQKFKLDKDTYLISRQQVVEKILKKEMESIKDILESINVAGAVSGPANSAQYIGNALYTNLITTPLPITALPITAYYDNIITKIHSANDIDFNTNTEQVDKINKILPSHINNLNLWLAYENVKDNKFATSLVTNPIVKEGALLNVAGINITYKPLDFFLLVRDGATPPIAVCNKIGNVIPLASAPNPALGNVNGVNYANASTQNIGIPNSYNTANKEFDFIDLLKKNMIEHVLQNMNIPASKTQIPGTTNPLIQVKVKAVSNNDFSSIWNTIYTLMETKFIRLESITEPNLYLQTMIAIIQVVDRIIISNIKRKIYLECVKLLKKTILQDTYQRYDNYKIQIEKFFDRIITQSNVSIKLEKTINNMISLPIDPTILIHDSFNINNTIDEDNISKIFNYGTTDSTTIPPITRDQMAEIYTKDKGNYLVHYTSDYNSIQVLSTRQCMRNSTSVVKKLFSTNNGFNPDIFKFDNNGYTPIFYAIKSGNYLLVRELIEIIKTNRNASATNPITIYSTSHPIYAVIYQLNKYGQSPIYYAFKQFKLYCNTIKPDWPMINVTFMNNLLLSAQINQNIPKSYYDSYKILVYHLNEFIKAIMIGTFYDFATLISINDAPGSTNPTKPFFAQQINNISTIDFTTSSTGTKNTSTIIEIINNIWSNTNLHLFDKIASDINARIIGHKSISHDLNSIKQLKTSSNFSSKLIGVKNLVDIFEEKYKPNRIYKYADSVKHRPIFDASFDNTKIKEVNRYYILLISMGIISIKQIFDEYFVNIIRKITYTTNILNFDVSTQNTTLDNHLKVVIGEFIDLNIFDFVRQFYLIKIDQYDRLVNTTSVIDEYMTKLIEMLIQNGLIEINSDMEKNIRQYVVPHFGELLTKTLQYNQVMIDILHKHLVNLYYSMKTFDELSTI